MVTVTQVAKNFIIALGPLRWFLPPADVLETGQPRAPVTSPVHAGNLMLLNKLSTQRTSVRCYSVGRMGGEKREKGLFKFLEKEVNVSWAFGGL